jgi:hypothetical protein
MSRKFGATVPPAHGGNLPTNNSNTGLSNRYCIHDVTCYGYRQSKKNDNTIDFEASSIIKVEEHIKNLQKLKGGVKNVDIA